MGVDVIFNMLRIFLSVFLKIYMGVGDIYRDQSYDKKHNSYSNIINDEDICSIITYALTSDQYLETVKIDIKNRLNDIKSQLLIMILMMMEIMIYFVILHYYTIKIKLNLVWEI